MALCPSASMSFVRFGHSYDFDGWDAEHLSLNVDASNVVVATPPALGWCSACKPQTGHLILMVTNVLVEALREYRYSAVGR
jgi:hypothetical protein